MSEQERDQSSDEEREETFQDLDVPEEEGEDIAGGKIAAERPDKI
jgi:hypothetical protein